MIEHFAAMWPAIKETIEALTYVAALVAAVGSWVQYRRNSTRERTRWLFDLYQRLYEQEALRRMRIRIDWGDIAFVTEEKKADAELLAELDNFLNFFEFVAILKKQKELKVQEVKAMFEYPLRMIASNGAVLAYVRKYSYEELDALLKELRYAS